MYPPTENPPQKNVWWLVVDVIKPCTYPLLKSESVCL